MSGVYADKAAAEMNSQTNRDHYNDLSDTMWLTAIIAGSAAGAIYVWNLIDAAAAPRENVYADADEPAPTRRFAEYLIADH